MPKLCSGASLSANTIWERAKKSLIKLTVVGHEIIKLWSEGRGSNESTTDTKSETSTQSQAEGHGYSEAMSEGSSAGQTTASSEMTGMLDGEELAVTRHTQSTAEISAKTSGESFGSSKSHAFGTSDGQGTSLGETSGTSGSQSYSESLLPVFKDLPTAIYSLGEQKHIFTDMVISLPPRIAFAVLAGEGMAKIETLDVPDLIISPKRKDRIKIELKSTSGIHKEPKEIEVEIRERFQAFMIASHEQEHAPVTDFDPMAPVVDFDPMNPTE